MGRVAENIYTSHGEIARLDRYVHELAVNAHVRIRKRDGDVVEGIVAVTPTVQIFRDAAENEGMNGVVKLEDPKRPGWDDVVWLGDIREITHLDSVTKGASKA